MFKKRRKLITVKTAVEGSGEDATFSCHFELPMSDATADESANAAARIMDAVNAQLDFSKSDYRLRMWSIKEKKWVKVSYPTEAANV